jgi:hypothetical protein
MNVEPLEAIARWLEAGTPHKDGVVGFNMSMGIVRGACGTTCCIAGAACEFFSTVRPSSSFFYASWSLYVAPEAKKILGLSDFEAHALFFGPNPAEFEGVSDRREAQSVTPAWAARCIRRLIATGKVDWQGTRDETTPPANLLALAKPLEVAASLTPA